MTHQAQTFTVLDPRTFEGDPFEVAERACAQAEHVARLLADMIEKSDLMARNADMSRRDDATGVPGASEWDSSPQGKKFRSAAEDAVALEAKLRALGVASSYNPKRRKA
jgi:hypothetical protein